MYKAEEINFLDVSDFALVPIYLFFIIIIALLVRSVSLRKSPIGKYFMPGLLLKIIGGLGVGWVYGFYYKGGDTFYYYYDSNAFNLALKGGLDHLWKLFMLPANTVTTITYQYTHWLTYFRDSSGWTADKIYGVISILSFHSYPVMSIMMSTLCFTGVWALYKTFADLYPQLNKQLAFCVLFVPSVFFWGSGILKDSITFGAVGWITYGSYLIFFKRKNIFRNVLMLFCVGYLALMVKAYIIISFLPALMFWIFLTYRSRIPNKFVRVASGPLIGVVSIAFGYFLVSRIGAEFSQFSLENVRGTAQTFQIWHTYLAENSKASGYSLGSDDGSVLGMLIKFPLAVNVTLFRPYLWEANSVIMLVSAIESTFILGFTLYILWKNGLPRTLKAVVGNPTVFFCIFFSLIFAFAVGFTSYNFGALVRYKIPCIPFYLSGLIILNYVTALERKKLEYDRNVRQPQLLKKLESIEEPSPIE